jgi:hypothetical protein
MTDVDLRTLAVALDGEVSGPQVLAPGPGHSPKDRSLSVMVDPDAPDGFVIYSHAGDDPMVCRDHVKARMGLPAWTPGDRADRATPETAATKSKWTDYIYRDAEGSPYLRVQRTPDKRFIQSHWTGRAWSKGKPNGPKIPYRLPELVGAVHDTVFIVEGEKDADALSRSGLIVTTASEGAGKWTEDLNRWFKGKTVYILPDNDKAGSDHGEQVARNLVGVANEVRIVNLPGLPPKGDVSDWLDSGGDTGALVDICKAQPLYGVKAALKRGVTAAALQVMTFPPVQWIVEGYVAEGLTLLAGKPKLGKSWLALDIALAVALGGVALGVRQCAKGAVLYAALEDTPRRLQDRLGKVHGAWSPDAWPANLTFWTYGEMGRLDAGGLDQLRAWIAENPGARLIIIDTFAKVRSGPQGKEGAYDADYREVGSLKALADETGVAIILITHTRKMAADDRFDTVSGTLGITGAADTTLILAKDGQGVTLSAIGRDVAEVEMAVEFGRDLFRWREIGEAAAVRRSDERGALLDALLEAGEPMNSKELASETGQTDVAVRRLLAKMFKAGEVRKAARGKYRHPDLDPGNSGNEGNNGKVGEG